jgi:hypothetical protein
MSACLRIDPYALSELHGRLRSWGYICERTRLANAYRSCDTTYAAAHGGGSGEGVGLRVLDDIPSWAVQMSHKVRCIPEDQSNAVTMWYCYQLRPGHQLQPGQSWWWTHQERAMVLGITEWELRRRVREGKNSLIVAGA